MSDDTPKKVDLWLPGDPLEEGEESPTLLCWVTPTIAIGPYAQARDFDLVSREGIVAVVSIGELRPDYPRDLGLHHEKFPMIEDCTDSYSDYEIRRVVEAIVSAAERGKTLVHCAAGVSRSPGFTTAALCHRDDKTWEEAFAIVKAGREKADVHHLVAKRLREWVETVSQNR